MNLNVTFPVDKGTYIIVFRFEKDEMIYTKKKEFVLSKGNYCYVGSAFGAGGLNARLKRHLKKNKKKHWHFDYVSTLDVFKPISIYCFIGKKVECEIARRFAAMFDRVVGFGCSDCSCDSHLFVIDSVVEIDKIIADLPFVVFKFGGDL